MHVCWRHEACSIWPRVIACPQEQGQPLLLRSAAAAEMPLTLPCPPPSPSPPCPHSHTMATYIWHVPHRCCGCSLAHPTPLSPSLHGDRCLVCCAVHAVNGGSPRLVRVVAAAAACGHAEPPHHLVERADISAGRGHHNVLVSPRPWCVSSSRHQAPHTLSPMTCGTYRRLYAVEFHALHSSL